MNTKEAIEIVETAYDEEREIGTGNLIPNYTLMENIPAIVKLLQRGEKFEKIERGIKQYCLILENQNVLKEVIRLEQKYFPKLLGVDYGIEDFTCKLYGKMDKNGNWHIEKVEYIEPFACDGVDDVISTEIS